MKHSLAYRYGLSVPTIDLKLSLEIPDLKDLNAIDNFLVEYLQVPADDLKMQKQSDNKQSSAWKYVMRLLHANSALLRIGHLPVFFCGKIIAIEKNNIDSNKWRVQITASYIDDIPINHLVSTIKVSAHIIQKVNSANDIEYDHFDKLIKNVMRPLRMLTGSGISTLPILRAAHMLGIPVRHLGMGHYRLGWGANSRVFSRSAVDEDTAIGAAVSSRKDHTIKLLVAAGIPCPEHFLVHSLQEALSAAGKLEYPVVVKPADRERSEGVTAGISDNNTLAFAWKVAHQWSSNILVESHIDGRCYRLMVANRKVLYVVKRMPRSIIGDGVNTINYLLELDAKTQLSRPFWIRKKQINADEETISSIERQGYKLASVPQLGDHIWLRNIESTEWGETTVDVTADVHPDNMELAERAARALGLSNAGIDLITTDITRPWWESGGKITEVNFRPHFGGTIAAQQRMTAYLDSLLSNRGRIPIHIYYGQDDAYVKAHQRLMEDRAAGRFSVLCTNETMQGPHARIPFDLPQETPVKHRLYAICRIALQDARVETLLVVIQDVDLFDSGFPFDRVNSLECMSSKNVDAGDPSPLLEKLNKLVTLA
jgi:cyanophycin synthetase